jgi:undecaprenyl-diphosphatase
MITWLTSLDVALFHLINGQGRNSFFDWLMPYITDLNHFHYYLLALGVWLLWKERKPGLVFLIFLGLTLAITDPFSSHLLKYWISRVRPCQILPDVHLLTDCNTSPSFPSSHAVNVFAAAFFLAQPFKKISPILFAIAGLVAYSRIYIGVHYPLDVLGGAAIGITIAWPMRWLKDRAVDRLLPLPSKPKAAPGPGVE